MDWDLWYSDADADWFAVADDVLWGRTAAAAAEAGGGFEAA